MRHLTLRNLLKKVALKVQANPEQYSPPQYQDKPYILPLSVPFKIMVDWDPELDMDELECVLANLIAMGYIKGYISHEQNVLVLAKEIEKAFPVEAFSVNNE